MLVPPSLVGSCRVIGERYLVSAMWQDLGRKYYCLSVHCVTQSPYSSGFHPQKYRLDFTTPYPFGLHFIHRWISFIPVSSD